MKSKFELNKNLIYLLLIALIFVLLPLFLRFYSGNPVLSGQNIYHDLRVSSDLSQSNYWDSIQDKPHNISLFHYILSLFSNQDMISILICMSIVLALLSVFLFYKIQKHFFKDEKTILLSTLLFILSPIFINLFSRPSEYTLATFFTLSFIYFLLRKNYLSIIFLSLVGITNISFLLIDIFLLIIYFLHQRKQLLFWSNLLVSIVSLFLFHFFHPNYKILKSTFITPSFSDFFISFGAVSGISFFYVFLGLIGLFSLWKRGKNSTIVFSSIVIVVIFSLFAPAGRILLNFYLSALSGAIIIFLVKREWAIIIVKKFTLLLILCGIIFSSALYLDEMVAAQPNNDLIKSLEPIKDVQGKVLSYESYGYFIEYFSSNPVLIDKSSYNYDNYDLIKQIQTELFYSRNLETTTKLLSEENIKYILISPEMKSGLIWKKDSEGLLFLLENSPNFRLLFNKNEFELWEVLFYK